MAGPLHTALALLEAGDDERAVTPLLQAWRETPSPELARLLEVVSARAIAHRRPAPPGLAALLRRASGASEVDLPLLLDALPDGALPISLLDALRRFAPDPRLAAALLSRVGELQAGAAPLYRGLTWTPAPVPLDAADRALVVERLDRLAPGGQPYDALLAAVYAAPDDDRPRQVLADWLLERDDPRGELIALQLAEHTRALRPRERDRARELIRRHGQTWLGRLGDAVALRRVTFERGFPAHVTVGVNGVLRVRAEPAWATVTELELSMGAVAEHLAELLAPPRHGLRALRGIDAPALDALRRLPSPPPLTTLGYEGPYSQQRAPERVSPAERDLLVSVENLPRLERLQLRGRHGLPPAALRFLWSCALGRGLRALEVQGAVGERLHAWYLELATRPPGCALDELVLRSVSPLVVTLARGPDGAPSMLRARVEQKRCPPGHLQPLIAAVEKLPPHALTHVSIVAPDAGADERRLLERAVLRQRRIVAAELP